MNVQLVIEHSVQKINLLFEVLWVESFWKEQYILPLKAAEM